MKPKIIQQEGKPEVPTEIIAQHIEAISKGMKEINAGRLTKKAIIVLLQNITGMAQSEIKKVLDAQEVMANVFLKPRGK